MATATVVAVSVIVALLRGGRLHRQIPGLSFPVLALLVQRPLAFLYPGTLLGNVANVAGYLVALPFWWLNRRSMGLRLVLAGMLLNLLVITLNGGQMPVDYDTAASIGVIMPPGPLAKHQPMGLGTYLPFLGDVIPVRWPYRRMVSIGDLLLFFGIFLFVQEALDRPLMRSPTPQPTAS